MALTLTDLTSQYGVLQLLVSYLWKDDLDNLAVLSREIREHVRGTAVLYRNLLELTLRCDGSSGAVWRRDFINSQGEAQEAFWIKKQKDFKCHGGSFAGKPMKERGENDDGWPGGPGGAGGIPGACGPCAVACQRARLQMISRLVPCA